jgi:hypothetical protein
MGSVLSRSRPAPPDPEALRSPQGHSASQLSSGSTLARQLRRCTTVRMIFHVSASPEVAHRACGFLFRWLQLAPFVSEGFLEAHLGLWQMRARKVPYWGRSVKVPLGRSLSDFPGVPASPPPRGGRSGWSCIGRSSPSRLFSDECAFIRRRNNVRNVPLRIPHLNLSRRIPRPLPSITQRALPGCRATINGTHPVTLVHFRPALFLPARIS